MWRGCAERRLGGWPVGTVLGLCGAIGDVQWCNRGFEAVVFVDSGANRFWPYQ